MLIRVDDVIINTDKITFINIKQNNSVKVFFGDEHHRLLDFTTRENMEVFLSSLGTIIHLEK